MKINHTTLFPSIVSEIECDYFNLIKPNLIEWIYNYQKNTDSVIHSNRGGWQSPSNLHLNHLFFDFFDYIIRNCLVGLSHYNTSFRCNAMWININKKGDYNMIHDHPNSVISGVLWVKVPDNCGSLLFCSPQSFTQHSLLQCIDPKIAKNQNYYSNYEFYPKEGTILLFPSNLFHGVEENKSNEDRISIAFNLTC